MNIRKLTALLVCLCLVLALAGCGSSTEVVEYSDDEIAEQVTAAEEADTAEADDTAAAADTTDADASAEESGICLGGIGYSMYDPDTVVGSVNGDDVTWQEYYYWLNYWTAYVQQLAANNNVTLTSWDANELSSTNTNAQVVILNAQYSVVQYHVYQQEAASQEITTLNDEASAELESIIDSNADSYCGDGDGEATEEELTTFEAFLEQNDMDIDFFRYLNTVSLLNEESFIAQYGENGENYSDEDTLAYAADNGLMKAKHILLATVDVENPDSETGEYPALDEETCTEKEALAEDLLAQLQAVQDDPAQLESLFDELMNEYSEDTGLANYPDGYIFSEGEMIEAFEDAVKELDENDGLSGVVESEYGYHIILRLPLSPDDTIADSYGNSYTLRNIAASQAFTNYLSELQESADVQWGEGFSDDALLLQLFG